MYDLYLVGMEASVVVQFTYTPTYPDAAPVIEIKESDNLEEEHIQELVDLLTEQVSIIHVMPREHFCKSRSERFSIFRKS